MLGLCCGCVVIIFRCVEVVFTWCCGCAGVVSGVVSGLCWGCVGFVLALCYYGVWAVMLLC